MHGRAPASRWGAEQPLRACPPSVPHPALHAEWCASSLLPSFHLPRTSLHPWCRMHAPRSCMRTQPCCTQRHVPPCTSLTVIAAALLLTACGEGEVRQHGEALCAEGGAAGLHGGWRLARVRLHACGSGGVDWFGSMVRRCAARVRSWPTPSLPDSSSLSIPARHAQLPVCLAWLLSRILGFA